MKQTFINQLGNDEVFDLINGITNSVGETCSIIAGLEATHGTLLSGSSGTRHALENGLIPFNGGKYDGIDEEYHHFEFEISGVVPIPFRKYEE